MKKIDSTQVFVKIVVDDAPIDGRFKIVKGGGDLSGELFVQGVGVGTLSDGTKVQVEIVYPYSKVSALMVSEPAPIEKKEEETV